MRRLALLLLALLLCGAGSSEDRLREYVAGKWTDFEVADVRRVGDWCAVDLRRGEERAQLLFHEDGGWRLVNIRSRSLTFSPDELVRVGVPLDQLERVLGEPLTPKEREQCRKAGPFWEILSQRPLARWDGYATDSWSLMLGRNEVYARHGRAFQDPFLKAYFASRPWYRVRPGFRDSDLSALERANVKALQQLEAQQRAKEAVVR